MKLKTAIVLATWIFFYFLDVVMRNYYTVNFKALFRWILKRRLHLI